MPNYGDPSYWEQRYKEQEGTTFDWLEDYEALQPLFEHALGNQNKEQARILNLGCGNSILPEEMYDQGYKQIFNVDISQSVIEQMSKRNASQRPELKWEVMDVRSMQYPSQLFDIIIDKSTIDALLCGDNAFMNTALMLKECQRVLKDGGTYMAISYGTPENRLVHFKRQHLKFEISTFQISPEGAKSKDTIHYVYVLKKQQNADQHCDDIWPQTEQQIKKEEQDDDALDDSEEEIDQHSKEKANEEAQEQLK